ncbi:MAG: hypothetical protein Q8P39_03795 [Candidatus Yanofskybacteria bacterium]|nr:hypothetical protein [Candidatus Yanofskybacteria bacterium]
MLKRKAEPEADLTQEQLSLAAFLELYNNNLPEAFLPASVARLKEFQNTYPSLFRHGDTWSVAQHRKRVMDWLSSYKGNS